MEVSTAILISARSEWRAVLEYIDPPAKLQSPFGEYFLTTLEGQPVLFFHSGVGKITSAASTQYVIDQEHPQLIVNLGTCGGIAGEIEVGEIVLANETVLYDIYERMGDPDEAIRAYTTTLDLDFIQPPYPQPVRVCRLASADQDIDPQMLATLREKFHVAAADWESGAIAWVAKHNHTRCLILRGVTDLVSAEGDETYQGGIDQYHRAAGEVMRNLLNYLPDWLKKIK